MHSFGAEVVSHHYINDLPAQLENSCGIFAEDTMVHAASAYFAQSCKNLSPFG